MCVCVCCCVYVCAVRACLVKQMGIYEYSPTYLCTFYKSIMYHFVCNLWIIC